MTRALRRRRLAFAGADRMRLSDHMAVLDLVSAGRAALYRDDDLALAEVLKSPLIGLDDDALISARARSPRFARRRTGEKPNSGEAAARVETWRRRARTLSPFDFYARLIGADGGRRALISRLGAEAADAIDEFLAVAMAFESATSPSLSEFLDEVSASESEIKREFDTESVGVRVMTIHAAKGLEAPIVFLPDTLGKPQGPRDPRWLAFERQADGRRSARVWVDQEGGGQPAAAGCAHARGCDGRGRAPAAALCRDDARRPDADRRRRGGRSRAARRLLAQVDPRGPRIRTGRHGRRRGRATKRSGGSPTRRRSAKWTPSPIWRRRLMRRSGCSRAPKAELAPPSIAPSRASAVRRDAARSSQRHSREAGLFAHALIERLPAIAEPKRAAAAERFLAAQNGPLPEAEKSDIADRVLRLIADPAVEALFGPGSRAEVPISGALPRTNGPPLAFSGRIDRLVVRPERIEMVDFKSGRSGRDAYVAQLALYVAALKALYQRPVEASLVWLDSGSREAISAGEIGAALEALQLAPGASP